MGEIFVSEPLQLAIEALESAQNGLRWYRDAHPKDESEADNEADELIERALAGLRHVCGGSDAQAAAGPSTNAGAANKLGHRPFAPLQVIIRGGRVWIERGHQSFMLAYNDPDPTAVEWYASVLRQVLSLPPVNKDCPVVKFAIAFTEANDRGDMAEDAMEDGGEPLASIIAAEADRSYNAAKASLFAAVRQLTGEERHARVRGWEQDAVRMLTESKLPPPTDEQIHAAAERWHDVDTLGDPSCPTRGLEILGFLAGAKWELQRKAPT